MESSEVYATPHYVSDLKECFFYHTIDLPEYGTQYGVYDLRPGAQAYLGHVPIAGKRVLDVGTANGFLCFHMERQGADVVAYDLSDGTKLDIVPYVGADLSATLTDRAEVISKINNAYWFAHRLYKSNAKVAYGTVYSIPEAIGPVDVVTFGAILLHLRDPFLALQKALKLARDTVIITELVPVWQTFLLRSLPFRQPLFTMMRYWHKVTDKYRQPRITFLPNYRNGKPEVTWWQLSPKILQNFIGILGFGETKLKYHTQLYRGKRVMFYTLVGKRTSGKAT